MQFVYLVVKYLQTCSCINSIKCFREKVRLGMWTNETNSDCLSVGNRSLCIQYQQPHDIESITVSGQYDPFNGRENNIALIKLTKEVKYSSKYLYSLIYCEFQNCLNYCTRNT